MRLYSYVVARDFGFAPNPFFGTCTLAACKPMIRGVANVGDLVVGTGSKTLGRRGFLVYVMQISRIITFDEYWNSESFLAKRPNLKGSVKQAFGDNIYHRAANGQWVQANSHHSLPNGAPNIDNIVRDTGTDRVLISDKFIYWGRSGPQIPERFCDPTVFDIRVGRGHKSRFAERAILEFAEWLSALGECGYVDMPIEWKNAENWETRWPQ